MPAETPRPPGPAASRSRLSLALASLAAAARLAVVAILLGVVPVAAQQADEPPQPEPEIAVDSDAGADSAIAERIRAIFSEIEPLRQVAVTVDSGVVTLRGTVLEPQAIGQAERLAGRVAGVVTVQNELRQATGVDERLTPVLDRFRQRIGDVASLVPLLAVALAAFAIILLLGIVIAAARWPWNRLAPNSFVAELYRQIVRLAFFVAAAVVALDIMGATALLGTLLGAAGIVGLALGFAVRDTVENYIASILLSIRQPFRPNDHVLIEGNEGHVVRLTSRATILLSLDGNHVRIPNAAVYKAVITNFTMNPQRRFTFALGVDADSDLNRALDLGLATMADLGFVLESPAPLGWIEQVGESNVELTFAGWIDQRRTSFAKARGETIRMIKLALERAGFSLPEPIYRLRFDDSFPGLAATEGRSVQPGPAGGEPEPAVAPPRPRDAAAETDLSQKVAEERAGEAGGDLLDPQAPRE